MIQKDLDRCIRVIWFLSISHSIFNHFYFQCPFGFSLNPVLSLLRSNALSGVHCADNFVFFHGLTFLLIASFRVFTTPNKPYIWKWKPLIPMSQKKCKSMIQWTQQDLCQSKWTLLGYNVGQGYWFRNERMAWRLKFIFKRGLKFSRSPNALFIPLFSSPIFFSFFCLFVFFFACPGLLRGTLLLDKYGSQGEIAPV